MSAAPGQLIVSWQGKDAANAAVVAEILDAVDGLFRAVAKEVTGEEIGLEVVRMAWCCDGCGLEVDAIPADWTKRDADDLCAVCSEGEG